MQLVAAEGSRQQQAKEARLVQRRKRVGGQRALGLDAVGGGTEQRRRAACAGERILGRRGRARQGCRGCLRACVGAVHVPRALCEGAN